MEIPLEQRLAPSLTGRRIMLAVSGGIACFRAVELCSLLRKAGAELRVTMTESAAKFVTPLSFEAIAGGRARTHLFDDERDWAMDHIGDARWAEMVAIVPATANILAKLAHGQSDCPVSTLCLAYRGPLLAAPAMNWAMYEHPATQANVRTLRDRGVTIVGPDEGHLACGETGSGRLVSVESIAWAIAEQLTENANTAINSNVPSANGSHPNPADDTKPLRGKTVLVTAGPTREFLDPARFISNPSTGKMGYALAAEASRLGARAILVSGPTHIPPPEGVEVERVISAADMLGAVQRHFQACDILVFAAAPADYRPATTSPQKEKKGDGEKSLALVSTDDIAAWSGKNRREGQTLIGFAAETHDGEMRALEKLARKKLDWIVLNDISRRDIGFASDDNEVALIRLGAKPETLPKQSKTALAREILMRTLGVPAAAPPAKA